MSIMTRKHRAEYPNEREGDKIEEEEEEEGEEEEKEEKEELLDPADSINPYEILSIDKSATQDQIKSAYRKAALRYHPDKVGSDEKGEAHTRFQEIATAYAILSDVKRRHRYDKTGSTAESLDDDDFDWLDFFREQSAAVVSGDMIDQVKKEYQGSTEEREDVLRVYEDGEGDMDLIYESIMCSNVLQDDTRFRGYIDDAVKEGLVGSYERYSKENKDKRRKRAHKAKLEEQEALELAEELGVKDKLFSQTDRKGKGPKSSANDEDALRALIQQRQQNRSENFFEQLEAKYGGGKTAKRKKRDEPPENLFAKNAKKSKGRK